MTTTTATPGGLSTSLGLMSCVRESSPQELLPQTENDLERNEPSKKRRFHPFRNLRKIFRRTKPPDDTPADSNCLEQSSGDGGHRSRSTSELLSDEPRKKSSGGPLGGGALSVSHDSVFTAEQRSTSSEMGVESVSVESLSIQQLMQQTGVRAELLDVVRRRGRSQEDTSEDEEDLGLPRSPCNSPTTTDKTLKEHPTKSHSTCSDGSLLSMDSSEMDEDSFNHHSRHSSKLSLHEKRPSQITAIAADFELELGASINATPLSHSAARHKMSVRPKRTHGAPRKRRVQQLTVVSALPATPEVNEEVVTRSLTPEGSNNRETISELYSTSVWSASNTETQLKSASLPPGLALASAITSKITRSRSNARDIFVEEDEEQDKKKEESFFGRFLARRSGKKKKEKCKSEDDVKTDVITYKSVEETKEKRTFSVDSGISAKNIKSGPASRQRIQPIDIPSSPDSFRYKRQQTIDLELPPLPTKASTSPEKDLPVPVPSPRTILPNKTEIVPSLRTLVPQSYTPPKNEIVPAPRNLPKENKVKITGLSSYQQKVLSYNDEIDNLDTSDDSITLSISKSQSFRAKSASSSQQEHSSLPYTVNIYDMHSDSEDNNEVKIINTNVEEDFIEEQKDCITISCVNSQMQASVNTKSSNQVVVSISNPEPIQNICETVQVSITKVQLKNTVKNSEVPEFLKIQLNKVDAKPTSNVVLSTSNSFSKADKQTSVNKENGEIDTIKNKCSSTENIEIIDKPVIKPNSIKPFLKKKSNSLDLDSIKIEEKSKLAISVEHLPTENTDVIMRRKSLNSQKNTSKEPDEPELLKVFARRSLKLKDIEAETLSQQVVVLLEETTDSNKRDSDKENESESPIEERKKPPKTKEPLTEKISDEVTLRKPSSVLNNKFSVFGSSKYQRSVSLSSPINNKLDEERKNNSFIEPKNYKSTHIINEIKKSEIKCKTEEIITSSLKKDFENEDFVPRFKRIQQRKEEWEQRAQQNMKKT